MPTELRLPFDDEPGPSDPMIARDEEARAFAVDPSRNVVLEASAGTGKTRVLVTRYINLLRANVDPANILAITFTRKAAAEMRERIVQELRKAAPLSAADGVRWRALRDRLGDIGICTIDAFCFSLLREFPLEADLDPAFTVADETATPRLVEEALDGALRAARRLAAGDADVALLLAAMGERKVRVGLAALLDRRLVAARAMRQFLAAAQGPGPAVALDRVVIRLRDVLDSGREGLNGFLRDGPVDHPGYSLLEADLRWLAGVGAGPALEPAGYVVTRAVLDRVARYFVTDKGEPRARPPAAYQKKHCASPSAWSRHSAAVASLAPYVAEALGTFERDLNVAMVRGASRLFRIACGRYRQALETQAALDYPEGLARSLRLLRRMDEFAQSRYRLEARYHHVLVDEFQDTSRAQWRLVARLIESWGEGVGLAQDAPVQPSIFVVGDRKQSIYAFRDADVRMLRRARRYIGALRPGGDVRRSISRSFRSEPGLLAFANDLFSRVGATAKRADAFRFRTSDRFPVTQDATAPPSAPCLGMIAAEGALAAAHTMAAEVVRILEDDTVRDRQTGVPRGARPGDIAILFRSRETHREIEAALEARGVPTYVYKGLGFFDADEVKDLVALLRYFGDPSSDLRAAALLRSRVVRMSDPALRSLGPRFAAALNGSPRPTADLPPEDARLLDRLRASLRRWLPLVDRVAPAEVLDRVLDESAYMFELQGPRLVQARENLKKVRSLTRRLQNRGYATLARVAEHLDRLSAGDESNAVVDALDAVNLMTVHAAKGLEFPIVFLASLGRGTSGHGDPILIVSGDARGTPLVSVGGGLADADRAVRDRDREETKRLLYVAVTRARERLYLSAVLKAGRFTAAQGSLAEVVPASLRDLFAQAAAAGGSPIEWRPEGGGVHRFAVPAAATTATRVDLRNIAVEPGSGHGTDLGRATGFAPLLDAGGTRRVGAVACAMDLGDAGEERGTTEQRARDQDPTLVGTLVHRLFQAIPSADRADSAAVLTGGMDEAELTVRALAMLRAEQLEGQGDAEAIARTAASAFLALRHRPDVAALLDGADCLYEVPFSMQAGQAEIVPQEPANAAGERGAAHRPVVIRGSIDCLVRRPDGRVVVLEIKTGQRRSWHARQLDLYVRAARVLFPEAEVAGRLIYAES